MSTSGSYSQENYLGKTSIQNSLSSMDRLQKQCVHQVQSEGALGYHGKNCFSQDLYVKILVSNVTVFGGDLLNEYLN